MKKMPKWLYFTVMAVLLIVFLVSAASIIRYFVESRQAQDIYDDLADMVQQAKPAPTDPPEEEETPLPPVSPYVTVTHPKTGQPVEVLPEYAPIFQLNGDIVGWIYIPGTNINYPVMQTGPETTDYYLRRDFYGNYSTHGCIYAREQCDVFAPSDNITIYGHRMQDQTMFGQLAKYERKDFCSENSLIYFDTLKERHTYQIVKVFKTSVSIGSSFYYHLYEDFSTEEEFQEFMNQCDQKSLYTTGVSAQYGDKLITLSTCEYTLGNGRLVIVAKRIA